MPLNKFGTSLQKRQAFVSSNDIDVKISNLRRRIERCEESVKQKIDKFQSDLTKMVDEEFDSKFDGKFNDLTDEVDMIRAKLEHVDYRLSNEFEKLANRLMK